MVDLKSVISQYQDQGFEKTLKKQLEDRGIKDLEELEETIENLEIKLGLRVKREKTDAEKYGLIEIPDDLLTPEQVKTKRIQKMHKTSSEMREVRRKKEDEEHKRIDDLKDEDRDLYIKGLYDQRHAIMERIELRKKQVEQCSKRGSLKNKLRLRVMAGMVHANDNDGTQFHKPGMENDKKGEDAMFGYDDEDWNIYRGINKGGFDDENEDDIEAVNQIEKQIADVDP